MKFTEVFNGSRLKHVFDLVEQSGTVSEAIEECETAWVGGIVDFGDKMAATVVQRVPEYEAYAHVLRGAVRLEIGFPLNVYRLWDVDHLDDWKVSGHSENVAVSLDQQIAKSFLKFAKASKTPQVVATMVIRNPDAIVMRGKLEEMELVIDLGWVDTADVIVSHAAR